MKYSIMTALCCFSLLFGANALGQDAAESVMGAAKTGPMSVVSPSLAKLHDQYTGNISSLRDLQQQHNLVSVSPDISTDGYVVIDAISTGDAVALVAELELIGLQNATAWGNLVSGRLPVSAIADLPNCPSLRFARSAAATTHVGLTTSQGDPAQFTDKVRKNEDVDGSGIRIGALSDSFDCLQGPLLPGNPFTTAADDVASNDLPADIIILDDLPVGDPTCIDEGRAMMQLMHDVAPGASQAFHTAFNGQADFANGIVELATQAGADVIVDDVIYFAEPMFQDGAIAQAVDTVKDMGVAYFSSAGNNARDAYDSAFRDSGVTGVFGGIRHDFDPGPGVDDLQSFTLATGTTIFSFQWDEPFASVSGAPGSASDVDIILYLQPGIFIGLGGFSFNIGGDAVEVFGVNNGGPPLTVELGLELFAGPAPSHMKYVFFGPSANSVDDFATHSGSLYGHANANGAEAVGAAAFFNTKRFNKNCKPACLNSFSSAGPTPIFFDTDGNPTLELRMKPEVVGPDGGNTTFFFADLPFGVPGTDEPDGFPNFFGTSASAPHVAALGALILEEEDELTPDQLYLSIEQGARDRKRQTAAEEAVGRMIGKKFDNDTGFGYVDGRRAIEVADDIEDFDSDDDDDDDDDVDNDDD